MTLMMTMMLGGGAGVFVIEGGHRLPTEGDLSLSFRGVALGGGADPCVVVPLLLPVSLSSSL